MKIKNYKHAKKIKTIKTFLFITVFCLVIPSITFGVWYKVVKHIEAREEQIRMDAWEAGYWEGGIEATKPPVEPKITPVLPSNNQGSKEAVLRQLAQIESGNGKVRKIMDTNGRYSLGLYHFQARTVQDMYKRYYKKNITIQEAVVIAKDDKLSTELAHHAIFVRGEKFHWKISMCKMGELKKGCLTQKQINNLFAKK